MSLQLFKLTINKEKLRTDKRNDRGLPREVIVCANDEEEARTLPDLNVRYEMALKITHKPQDTPDPVTETVFNNPDYVTCKPHKDAALLLLCSGPRVAKEIWR